MLNVQSKGEACTVQKRKDDLKVYELADHSRITWLEDAFLGNLDAWGKMQWRNEMFSAKLRRH